MHAGREPLAAGAGGGVQPGFAGDDFLLSTLETFNSSKSSPGQGRTAEGETAKEQSFLSKSCLYPLRKYLEAGAGFRPETAVIEPPRPKQLPSGCSVGSWPPWWFLWERQAPSSGRSGSRAGWQVHRGKSIFLCQTTIRCRTPQFEVRMSGCPFCRAPESWGHLSSRGAGLQGAVGDCEIKEDNLPTWAKPKPFSPGSWSSPFFPFFCLQIDRTWKSDVTCAPLWSKLPGPHGALWPALPTRRRRAQAL
ncbi:PREDICTED: uncharacterized protein LOC105854576 [Condylura cristata]|uniref:uncharacterized protein LOC105854576 n=1 Tax=Condylura cristata TaxID=143302 RepID=UPI000643293C|nr:PREDICTED: uncharacterized protein LOC105854576 [Condylura cristata]